MVYQAVVSYIMEYLQTTHSPGLIQFHINSVDDNPVCQGMVKWVYIYIDFNMTESDSSHLTSDM